MSLSKSRPIKRSQGFTLIEVLVAIAIFASLSVGAYQVLNQVQRSNEISLERSERLKALQRTLVFMDNDFRQMALRQSRTNGESPSAKLIQWQDYLLDSDTKGVMFTRLGWHNPQQQFPRGEVSKVGYRIKDDSLERVWWRYVDTPAGQEGIVMPLLTGVESFDMRFYDGSQWSNNWQQDYRLPKAVSVVLMLEDYGKIERIYLTTGAGLEQAQQGETDG
ncbi:type II secretion system protein GspJ [Vibrio aquaticus]|uniref:Type II secretion system protein J n=1 Tax=Vibrio aquaticus TaxID=2496559 RepID=A0A3S0P4X2_9VIBR|nr:type II secretion system minor pseudopilin GspJ [Vibrio aquaticus]RTZ14593.1 type II secretion system protein GspJ [Vibrio aquaticus]